MRIYPAIDIKDGKCVRLFKGDYQQMTVYSDNPIEVARDFENKGGMERSGTYSGLGVHKSRWFSIKLFYYTNTLSERSTYFLSFCKTCTNHFSESHFSQISGQYPTAAFFPHLTIGVFNSC